MHSNRPPDLENLHHTMHTLKKPMPIYTEGFKPVIPNKNDWSNLAVRNQP